ncbi:hypothetical protein P152DRAFT_468026 [Eremomyces bilateralis CBS 781.70]|uniref:Zn(2)-C6 fungal-type domain-containing protein n=1 Tax=Eremomyces bilateralis CBS 781.70 TaxID=1392243 RepID=A0A6G1FWK0_9PEZI|nr:uncharacterized protein P152DRAFT_468026 [Eremomyces bilateralis CBS 781.70]KAF1810060.1 hypothetical protein P152DRAFT_468026 [Eremomyces bilateralis CBS 781.70]
MQAASVQSRSRFGCTTCRRKHRKCDEQRPICRSCQSRGLECGYQTTLKWTSIGSINSFDKAQRQKNKSTKRVTTSTAQGFLASPPSTHATRSERIPSPEIPLQPTTRVTEAPMQRVRSYTQEEILTARPVVEDPPNVLDLDPASLDLFPELGADFMDAQCLRWPDIIRSTNEPHGSKELPFQDDFPGGFEMQESTTVEELDNDIQDGISGDDESCQDVSQPAGFSSWVIDNTLNSLLFQIFQSPGEEIAFAYYFKRVCTCIPAYDGAQNPYRKLALVALSYPVLLHGILSVATGHMYNYGRSSEGLLSLRQTRALNSLQEALNDLCGNKDAGEATRVESGSIFQTKGVFSILSHREIALAAIMMQTSSVLMTGIGCAEIHMKCASHFIRGLNYLHQPANSIFPRLLVYRFAMVDVVLAHLRFRAPLAPLDFYMYQSNEDLDHADPSFRQMQGCPQRVLCFLAQISVLSADIVMENSSQSRIQAKAYSLETEMRIWGSRYYDAMLRGEDNNATMSGESTALSPAPSDETPLDIVCECFYWTAHILLMRRVFLDPTRSTRVQMIRRHLFRLMDRLQPGCGPDSSVPFPFYMVAREAVTPDDRDWVRRKHAAMMEVYRDRSREYIMSSTERIWEKSATTDPPAPEGRPLWESPTERFIRETDRQATYFMF